MTDTNDRTTHADAAGQHPDLLHRAAGRLRIEHVLWRVDRKLEGRVAGRERRRIRRDLRTNLRDAAQDIGASAAVRRLGDREEVARGYVSSRHRYPRWALGVLWSLAAAVIVQLVGAIVLWNRGAGATMLHETALVVGPFSVTYLAPPEFALPVLFADPLVSLMVAGCAFLAGARAWRTMRVLPALVRLPGKVAHASARQRITAMCAISVVALALLGWVGWGASLVQEPVAHPLPVPGSKAGDAGAGHVAVASAMSSPAWPGGRVPDSVRWIDGKGTLRSMVIPGTGLLAVGDGVLGDVDGDSAHELVYPAVETRAVQEMPAMPPPTTCGDCSIREPLVTGQEMPAMPPPTTPTTRRYIVIADVDSTGHPDLRHATHVDVEDLVENVHVIPVGAPHTTGPDGAANLPGETISSIGFEGDRLHPIDLRLADFDSDGADDVAIALINIGMQPDPQSGPIQLLVVVARMNDRGQLTAGEALLASRTYPVLQLADMTGDEQPELLVPGGTYKVTNASYERIDDAPFMPDSAYHLAVGDVDGDGTDDIVSADTHVGWGGVTIEVSTARRPQARSMAFLRRQDIGLIDLGDVDGDDDLDLLLSSTDTVIFRKPNWWSWRTAVDSLSDRDGESEPVVSYHWSVMPGDGTGHFDSGATFDTAGWGPMYPDLSTERMNGSGALRDIDDDGRLDIVVAESSDPNARLGYLPGNGRGQFRLAKRHLSPAP